MTSTTDEFKYYVFAAIDSIWLRVFAFAVRRVRWPLRQTVHCSVQKLCTLLIQLLTQAKFRRRTSHEPNRMLMRENKGFFSFAFDSAHMKFGV